MHMTAPEAHIKITADLLHLRWFQPVIIPFIAAWGVSISLMPSEAIFFNVPTGFASISFLKVYNCTPIFLNKDPGDGAEKEDNAIATQGNTGCIFI